MIIIIMVACCYVGALGPKAELILVCAAKLAAQILKMARVIDAEEAADVKAKAKLRLSVTDAGEISVTEAIVVSTPGKGLARKRWLRMFVRAPCRYTPSGDGMGSSRVMPHDRVRHTRSRGSPRGPRR